jgi:hypothetical protein
LEAGRSALNVDGRAAKGCKVAQQVGVLPVQVAEDLDGRAHRHNARVAPEPPLLGQLAHAQQLRVAEQVGERTRAPRPATATAEFTAAAAPAAALIRRADATAVPVAAASTTTTIADAAAADNPATATVAAAGLPGGLCEAPAAEQRIAHPHGHLLGGGGRGRRQHPRPVRSVGVDLAPLPRGVGSLDGHGVLLLLPPGVGRLVHHLGARQPHLAWHAALRAIYLNRRAQRPSEAGAAPSLERCQPARRARATALPTQSRAAWPGAAAAAAAGARRRRPRARWGHRGRRRLSR